MIYVYGMGINGEGEDLTLSSKTAEHAQRVQANAPTNIIFDNITIVEQTSKYILVMVLVFLLLRIQEFPEHSEVLQSILMQNPIGTLLATM